MGPALSGSHVSSSKVCFYRLGHGTGGMAQRTRWATRPTATVTLGVARVPLALAHRPLWLERCWRERPSGPCERAACQLREREIFHCMRPAPLAKAGAGRGVLAWIPGSFAR